jgi:NAD(P)-dependent dehydrogenase (short-subunit alcohol dehydrogenase family)
MQNKIFSVKDKKILITGASTGLGRHFSRILVEAGAHVIACARRENLLQDLKNEVQDKIGKITILPLDILDYNSVDIKLTELFHRINGIDVLINNAGYSPKVKKPIFETNLDDWDEVFNTNLKALWNLTKITAKDMSTRKIQGSIINISSTVANRTRIGNPMYGISKTAVASLTQKLALEFAQYKIRVNAIAPGFFETDMNRNYILSPQGQETIKRTIPLERIGEYSELNGIIFLLSSNASTYITGECIFIDGGYVVNSVT